jgi:glycosyltransferase involved in cell wall biosynthesis
MKICFVRHSSFPDDPRLKKEVDAILQAGYEVDVICLKRKKQQYFEKINGANVYRIPIRRKRGKLFQYFLEYFFSFIAMSNLLFLFYIRKRYDAIQINTLPDFMVFVTILPKLLGAKIILDLHEPTPELWKTKYGENSYPAVRKLLENIEQSAIRYSDHSITVTSALRSRYIERGAHKNKLTVVPNVCNEEIYKPRASTLTNSNGHFTLITHGLIDERYGQKTAIHAINTIKNKIPQIKYEILGYGKKEFIYSLENMIQSLKCNDQIELLGYLSFQDYLNKLYHADIGVLSMLRSPYSELIDTNKMYEYIAIKTPVIVPNLAPIRKNFDDSCLTFFEPGNYKDLARCIHYLYENPDKRIEKANRAYKKFKKMRWENSKNIYLDVYKNAFVNYLPEAN